MCASWTQRYDVALTSVRQFHVFGFSLVLSFKLNSSMGFGGAEPPTAAVVRYVLVC